MSNTDSNTNQPRLLSFTLDGWSVLGGRITVSLHDGVAVLVGRNGAGKSAIIEGFEAISAFAIGKFSRISQNDGDSIPKILEVEILTPTNRCLQYKYELIPLLTSAEDLDIDESTNDNLGERQFSWNDHCQYVDEKQNFLWATKNETITFNNDLDPIIKNVSDSTSSFGRSYFPINSLRKFSIIEMEWIYVVLNRVRILGKNLNPRTKRRSSELKMTKKGVSGIYGLANTLSLKIFRRIEKQETNELESICQRVGIGKKITVQKFFQNGEVIGDAEGGEYYFSVELDGVNIGFLSDGTLKVLSILVEIIASSSSSTIIIEEPEGQIHPAMLAKLLNEIETYTYGENLILSTHSPQVVSWASPEKINLVHRKAGQTFVRKLGEAQIHNVIEYLSEEGNLGEWIYSGILDE